MPETGEEEMSKYISVYARCKCGHSKRQHIIEGDRPTKKHRIYASCGIDSYPIHSRYKGKCRCCKCNYFELCRAKEKNK